MSSFKDLRIVDNFYQTSSFFPMPTVCISTVNDDGSLNIGSYSLCFPYYIAGKERYAYEIPLPLKSRYKVIIRKE